MKVNYYARNGTYSTAIGMTDAGGKVRPQRNAVNIEMELAQKRAPSVE
jgi:hypothetical protein